MHIATELIAAIGNHITLIDQLRLCSCNRRLSALSSDFTIKAFREALSIKLKSRDYASRLISRLNKKTVLSGSFVAQVLLGETWEESDLDFYVERSEAAALQRFLWTIGFHESVRPAPRYGRSHVPAFQVQKFRRKDFPSIDVIVCDSVEASIHVFDFAFVRNKFDGSKVMFSGKSLTERCCKAKPDVSPDRVHKYQRRRFSILVDCKLLLTLMKESSIQVETKDLKWRSENLLSYDDFRVLRNRERVERERQRKLLYDPMENLLVFIRNHSSGTLRRRFAALCHEVDASFHTDYLQTYLDKPLSRALLPCEIFTGELEVDTDADFPEEDSSEEYNFLLDDE